MKIKVNTENLLSALIILGYDKIDMFTFTAIMANIRMGEYESKIEFVNDSELSKPFLSCVEVNSIFAFKIKENCDLNTNVAYAMNLTGVEYSFERYISSSNNVLFAEFIDKYVNLDKIIVEKIKTYGIDNINNFPQLFCDKEKRLIMEIFGINDMFTNMSKCSLKYNQMLYEQESRDIDNAIKTLSRIKNN